MLFRLYDSDGDGSVSREDVERVMEAMYKMVGPLLARERTESMEQAGGRDSEETGGSEELSVTLTARVKEIFKTLDKVIISVDKVRPTTSLHCVCRMMIPPHRAVKRE